MCARLRSAFALGALVCGGVLVGCTFLVAFDDVPDVEDAASDARARDRQVDATDDAEEGEGVDAGRDVAPFPPPCDEDFPREQVECPSVSRVVHLCARAVGGYPEGYDRESDLVRCGPNGATCVQHCPHGCIATRPNFDHQCDPCNGRDDGFYCGHELPGTPSPNGDLAIRCVDGRNADAAVCGVSRCAAPCSRAGGPQPSCCI